MNSQYKLIRCTINGKAVEKMVDVRASLTDMLRNDFRLTSVKKGCEVGECGACNVLIDGECFNSCLYLAAWADGKNIRTLEGLMGPGGELSDIQQAFIDEAAPDPYGAYQQKYPGYGRIPVGDRKAGLDPPCARAGAERL